MALYASANLPSFAGPLYVQVASIMRSKICASEWTSRAPLPNEVTLARDIGVSIGTVRKALEVLESERLIQRRQGRGTFVVEASDETELERFSNLMSNGRKLRTDRAEWSCVAADAGRDEAQVLMLQPGARVYRLQALLSAGECGTIFDTLTVSAARFPDLQNHLADAGQLLFPLYRRQYHEVISKVTEQVTAINADKEAAAKLKVRPDQALLMVSRIASAMSGGPVEWSRRIMHLTSASYTVSTT